MIFLFIVKSIHWSIFQCTLNTFLIIFAGYKLVFQPHPNNATCRETRYQPFIFDSSGYSECAFQKSHCNGEGQTTYGNGNRTSGRTCSCITDQEYTFVENFKNPCYCNPSTEDCSCYYFGVHSKNDTTGLKGDVVLLFFANKWTVKIWNTWSFFWCKITTIF